MWPFSTDRLFWIKSTFVNLLISNLSFQLEECLLLFSTSLLKTTVLLINERLTALSLELLDMYWETVELVIFLPWNLPPPPWKPMFFLLQFQSCFLNCLDYPLRFASALLSQTAVAETKGQMQRASYCHQALEKLLLRFSLILLTLLNGCWIIFQKNVFFSLQQLCFIL